MATIFMVSGGATSAHKAQLTAAGLRLNKETKAYETRDIAVARREASKIRGAIWTRREEAE